MGDIVLKNTEQVMIQAPREGYFRKINIGTDWTEMKFAFFLSLISATNNNAQPPAETIAISTAADHFTIGFKDDSLILPGYAGSKFVGIRANSTSSQFSSDTDGSLNNNNGSWRNWAYNGTTSVAGSAVEPMNPSTPINATTVTGTTAYCNFIGMRVRVTNRGLSSQQLIFQMITEGAIAGNDYSPLALRTKLLSIVNSSWPNNGSPGVVDWVSGGVALDIPDCIWIRSPMYNSRLRISCMRGLRIA